MPATPAGALEKLGALTNDGAEPAQVITDLADAVHAVTLVKAAGALADPAASEAERASAADLAKRLSMPVLARAWQMLLKGHEEVKSSPRPHAAADMVLVRLAYAADLPTPGDLMRRLGDSSGEAREQRRRAMPKQAGSARASPGRCVAETPPAPSPSRTGAGRRDGRPGPGRSAVARQSQELRGGGGARRGEARSEAQARALRAGAPRALPPGHLELNPLRTAPKELGQELMRKLKAWTGRVWIVALSDEEGAAPLGVQRREREAREIERIREHPEVKQVLAAFPRRAHRRGAGRRRAMSRQPRSTRGPRQSSRRTGPTHEEFRRA